MENIMLISFDKAFEELDVHAKTNRRIRYPKKSLQEYFNKGITVNIYKPNLITYKALDDRSWFQKLYKNVTIIEKTFAG